MSGYKEALEAAGAHIIAFESFGSYQGEWIAKIGEDSYIMGSYGSCSGCDSFEAEFGWSPPTPEELADFGRTYLDGQPYTKAELIERFLPATEWDDEATVMVEWLREN